MQQTSNGCGYWEFRRSFKDNEEFRLTDMYLCFTLLQRPKGDKAWGAEGGTDLKLPNTGRIAV